MENRSLGPKRKGGIAEIHVAPLLLTDTALDVLTAPNGDRHGSNLAVRSVRTDRWYSVLVRDAGLTVTPWIKAVRFRAIDNHLVVAAALNDGGLARQTFLIPGAALGRDTSGCVSWNDNGNSGAHGPYIEGPTTAATHAPELQAYDECTVLPRRP